MGSSRKPSKPVQGNVPAKGKVFDLTYEQVVAHNFDVRPTVSGIVQKVKTVRVKRAGEVESARMLVLATDDGEVVGVWESTYLGPFFDAVEPGWSVSITRTGTMDMGRNRRMTTFEVRYDETGAEFASG